MYRQSAICRCKRCIIRLMKTKTEIYRTSTICYSKYKMSMKPSTKFMKLIAPGIGVQVLGWDQYGYIVKMYWILGNLSTSTSGGDKLNVWLNVHEAPSAELFAPKDCMFTLKLFTLRRFAPFNYVVTIPCSQTLLNS